MSESVKIEQLGFSYPDGTVALDNVSVEINQSEKVGIVGANGAGKSTLVNHLNGYFLAQKGSIHINGIPLSKKTQEDIRRHVGVVFQNPDDQLFMTRLYDDIVFGPKNLGMSPEETDKAVETVLHDLNLWELRNKPSMHMSQGQKRFAAFATVLVMQPSIIVVDEPTSDLDPRNRRKLIRLMNSLKSTCITVSHDLDFIWDTCGRVLVMSAGKVVADGKTKEILRDKSLLEGNCLELPIRLQP
ncbi:MAG: ABC transporter ATP-binding protein [Victivallales bacterium]